MSVLTGTFGIVDNISSVRQFTINQARTTQTYRASNTDGATGRSSGIFGWNGSYTAYGVDPQVMPRDTTVFSGYLSPDSGVFGGVGTVATGSVLVDSVAITWNWETGEYMSHVVNFQGLGALTFNEAAVALADSTSLPVVDVCPTQIGILPAVGGVEAVLSDVTSATLTISAANQKYVSSSTNCTENAVKGSIDWTLSINRLSTTFSDVVSGTDYRIKIYEGVTDHWHLEWGIFKDYTNIVTDIEGATLIGYTMNFEMQAFNAGVKGEILKPGELTGAGWWPF